MPVIIILMLALCIGLVGFVTFLQLKQGATVWEWIETVIIIALLIWAIVWGVELFNGNC